MTDLPEASFAMPHAGYVLPAEDAAEMARLMLLDHLLSQAMGGPLPEHIDLSSVHQMLDIGCGPGGWLFDLVAQYPHLHGVGIDVSHLMIGYAAGIAASEELPQLHFRLMDATQPLSFPDDTFDLVHGRILTGFLSKQQWPALLAECSRITRPGGILCLSEVEWGFTTSAAYSRLSAFSALALYRAGHTFSPDGRTVGTTAVLRSLVQQAGYGAIQHRAHAVHYSAGTDFHESNVQNILLVHRMLQPFLVRMRVATQDELEQLHAQMEAEFEAADFCGVDYHLTVWGYKGP
jgi:ubiquinone/menaquinone biosynthesis C-methylase UbiE